MGDKKNKKKKKAQAPQAGYLTSGKAADMQTAQQLETPGYKGSGKLNGKVALLTGSDSGIGAAAAIAFAKEGADVVVLYYHDAESAESVCARIRALGRKAMKLQGDVGDEEFAKSVVAETVKGLGKIDVLVNNAAEQHPQQSIRDISPQQLERTFRTNIFSLFYMIGAALPHMNKGASIINTASLTAYHGSDTLMDYAATKGAMVALTRSLALNKEILAKGIRVNAIAPGPIWTPLIPASLGPEHAKEFGKDVPLGRPGQAFELAPAYVFLACKDSSYMTGQVLHPNGGVIVNG